jgi:hypothetical protein
VRGSQKVPEIVHIHRLVYGEFLTLGQSVGGHFYVQVLQIKRRDKWQAGRVVLYTEPHIACCVQFLADKTMCRNLTKLKEMFLADAII